jgi:uncharacterized protein
MTGHPTPVASTDLTPAEPRRRRWVVGGTLLASSGLLNASMSTTPGSARFYGLTFGAAATLTAGGLASGPVHRGWTGAGGPGQPNRRRPVLGPVLLGVGAFAVFYGLALIARHIPPLRWAISKVLSYAHHGSATLVLLTTLANGAAEEVFFRGAGYLAVGDRHPVALSTALYSLATTATRNPALVLASAMLGTLFGLQRRATGGVQAPMLTHLTWSVLMLRFLPPLFQPPTPGQPAQSAPAPGEFPSAPRTR